MKEEMRFCIFCKRNVIHRLYAEEESIMWNGKSVSYIEKGGICSVCGAEDQTTAEWNDSMQQIKG